MQCIMDSVDDSNWDFDGATCPARSADLDRSVYIRVLQIGTTAELQIVPWRIRAGLFLGAILWTPRGEVIVFMSDHENGMLRLASSINASRAEYRHIALA